MVTCSEEGTILAANATFTRLLAGQQLENLKDRHITALLEDFFDTGEAHQSQALLSPLPPAFSLSSPPMSMSSMGRSVSFTSDPPSPRSRPSNQTSPLVPRKARASKDSVFTSAPAPLVPEGTYHGQAIHADGGRIPVAYTVKHVVLENGERVYTTWVERRAIAALPARDHMPSRSASVGRTPSKKAAASGALHAGPRTAQRHHSSARMAGLDKLPRYSLDTDDPLAGGRSMPKSMPSTPLGRRLGSFSLLAPDLRDEAADERRVPFPSASGDDTEGGSPLAAEAAESSAASCATAQGQPSRSPSFGEDPTFEEGDASDDDRSVDGGTAGERPDTAMSGGGCGGISLDLACQGPFQSAYALLGSLGTGSFGCVRQVLRRRDGGLAVAKFLPKGGWGGVKWGGVKRAIVAVHDIAGFWASHCSFVTQQSACWESAGKTCQSRHRRVSLPYVTICAQVWQNVSLMPVPQHVVGEWSAAFHCRLCLNLLPVSPLGMIAREVLLLLRMEHQNIVVLQAAYHNAHFYQLVMENHGPGFDLFTFVDENPCVEETIASFIFRQVRQRGACARGRNLRRSLFFSFPAAPPTQSAPPGPRCARLSRASRTSMARAFCTATLRTRTSFSTWGCTPA